jgi:hypothetical protein
MFSWITKLFGLSQPKEIIRSHTREEIHEREGASHPATLVPEGPRVLDSEAAKFLLSLLCPEDPPVDLSDLPPHEREFISSNMRRLWRKEFEIPLLPGAPARIQQLLANPDVRLEELADIFKNDVTLSAELLRLANSSFLGYIYPTLDLQQAIIRIGFSQVQGLVMMFSLSSRILQVREYQHEVAWVTDLSLAMAKVCYLLAPELKMPPEEAFTLGLMHHVEYLVILGEAAKYTVSHRGQSISRSAIAESIRRVGMQLHSLIAQSWGITSFEKYYHVATGDAEYLNDVSDVPRRLDQLQHMLIETMAGGKPEVEIEGFDCVKLKECMETVVVRSQA